MRRAGLWILFAVIIAAMLSGCAGTPTYIKAYPGTELPRDQVALLKPIYGIEIIELDHDKSHALRTAHAVNYLEVEMAILAGSHSVEVRVFNGSQTFTDKTVVLDFEATAGRKYLINYTQGLEKRGAGTGILGFPLVDFHPRIEDVTDHPERWCAVAQDPNFKGCSTYNPSLKK